MRATVPPRPLRQQPIRWSDETLIEAHGLRQRGLSWPEIVRVLLPPNQAWRDEHLSSVYAHRIDKVIARRNGAPSVIRSRIDWTPDQLDQVAAWREAKLTWTAIAALVEPWVGRSMQASAVRVSTRLAARRFQKGQS